MEKELQEEVTKEEVTVKILQNFITNIEEGDIFPEEFSLEAAEPEGDEGQLMRLSLVFTSSKTPEEVQSILEEGAGHVG